ncbi:hypothetical protein AB0F42_24295 [Streptomyces buecherae]|uniref:hypothetical protein n=1 Tax=Streptomyces buecherae TaxID=2763006 RepID=UPI0034106022
MSTRDTGGEAQAAHETCTCWHTLRLDGHYADCAVLVLQRRGCEDCAPGYRCPQHRGAGGAA